MIDNYKAWEYAERDRESQLSLLPVCDRCHDRIQDKDYYDVDGEILCENCMKKKYRRFTDDLLEY